jgi:hypothetical protein
MGHNENKPAGHSRSAAGSPQACPSGYEKLVILLAASSTSAIHPDHMYSLTGRLRSDVRNRCPCDA